MQQPIALYQIEIAIRPQFVWNNQSTRKFEVDKKTHDTSGKGMGRIVFVGIAQQYNIPHQEIADYMALSVTSVGVYLKKFNLAHQREKPTTMQKRIKLKTGLVQNYIALHFHLRQYNTV